MIDQFLGFRIHLIAAEAIGEVGIVYSNDVLTLLRSLQCVISFYEYCDRKWDHEVILLNKDNTLRLLLVHL